MNTTNTIENRKAMLLIPGEASREVTITIERPAKKQSMASGE